MSEKSEENNNHQGIHKLLKLLYDIFKKGCMMTLNVSAGINGINNIFDISLDLMAFGDLDYSSMVSLYACWLTTHLEW